MSNLTPILTFRQSAEMTVAWTMQRLMVHGFQVERTFDLHAARMSQLDCPCPYHGTGDCTCQMVVLLTKESIIQALLPVMENSEI
jgi:hypothetical protein